VHCEAVDYMPEYVEEMNWHETDAEHDDDSDQHLGNIASSQHLTARVLDLCPLNTFCGIACHRVHVT